MDYYIFNLINQFALRWIWLDTLAIFFAQYFGYILIFLLLLFLVKNYKPVAPLPAVCEQWAIAPQLSKKYWQMVIQALLTAILARFIIVEIIRYFLPRSRPFIENHVNLLLDQVNQSAFPSGHAAFFFALSTVVYFYNKKTGLFFFFASFLISFFRVFAGIHWPSDILVGAIIGVLSGFLIILLFWKFSSIAKKQLPQ